MENAIHPYGPLASGAVLRSRLRYQIPKGPIREFGVTTALNKPEQDLNTVILDVLKYKINELETEKRGESSKVQISLAKEIKRPKQRGERSAASTLMGCTCEVCTVPGCHRHDPQHPEIPKKKTYNPLVGPLVKACQARGFTISSSYAEAKINANEDNLVRAFLAVQEDLESRERAIDTTGRILVENERAIAEKIRPISRDKLIDFLEYDDQNIVEFYEKGWSSFYASCIKNSKSTNKDQTYDMLTEEAHWRWDRQLVYKLNEAKCAKGTLSVDTFKLLMTKVDKLKVLQITPPCPERANSGNAISNSQSVGGDHDARSRHATVETDDEDDALGQRAYKEVNGDEHYDGDENSNDWLIDGGENNEGDIHIEEEGVGMAIASNSQAKKPRRRNKKKNKSKEKDNAQKGIQDEEAVKETTADLNGEEEFELPDEFPFKEYVADMPVDRRAVELKKMAEFMSKLKPQAERDRLVQGRTASKIHEPTEEELASRVEECGETELVKQLLRCDGDELSRHRFLIQKHKELTGSIYGGEPHGGWGDALAYFFECCPSITSTSRALEEIRIAGSSSVLAVHFANFREQHLDKMYGKDRKAYDEAEAMRFAAAVYWELDLDKKWVGPDGI